jgi:hypothetical protein
MGVKTKDVSVVELILSEYKIETLLECRKLAAEVVDLGSLKP